MSARHAHVLGTHDEPPACARGGLARVKLANRSGSKPAFRVCADESPVHRKLGDFEERA